MIAKAAVKKVIIIKPVRSALLLYSPISGEILKTQIQQTVKLKKKKFSSICTTATEPNGLKSNGHIWLKLLWVLEGYCNQHQQLQTGKKKKKAFLGKDSRIQHAASDFKHTETQLYPS